MGGRHINPTRFCERGRRSVPFIGFVIGADKEENSERGTRSVRDPVFGIFIHENPCFGVVRSVLKFRKF